MGWIAKIALQHTRRGYEIGSLDWEGRIAPLWSVTLDGGCPRSALGRFAAVRARRVGPTRLDESGFLGERVEDRVRVLEQVLRRVELGNAARRHDKDLIAVHD